MAARQPAAAAVSTALACDPAPWDALRADAFDIRTRGRDRRHGARRALRMGDTSPCLPRQPADRRRNRAGGDYIALAAPAAARDRIPVVGHSGRPPRLAPCRSEEHTSELQTLM